MGHGKIPPDWHYVSEKQSELWRAVAAAHAPSGGEDDPVARAYQEMFDETAAELAGGDIHLVGIGAGSGQKERRLAQAMAKAGCDVAFTAVDVSEALAAEAVRNLNGVISGKSEALVADFREVATLSGELPVASAARRRVFTGFGLSPNLLPDEFFPNIRHLVGRGGEGQALVSANLWPKASDPETELLVQYANDETRRWLSRLFVEWGFERVGVPELEFTTGEVDGISAVQVFAIWPDLSGEILKDLPAVVRTWRTGDRIEVFSSLRYSVENFVERTERTGMLIRSVRASSCGREAVFSVG